MTIVTGRKNQQIILVIQVMIMMITLMKEHQLLQIWRKDQAMMMSRVIPAVEILQIVTMVMVKVKKATAMRANQSNLVNRKGS